MEHCHTPSAQFQFGWSNSNCGLIWKKGSTLGNRSQLKGKGDFYLMLLLLAAVLMMTDLILEKQKNCHLEKLEE